MPEPLQKQSRQDLSLASRWPPRSGRVGHPSTFLLGATENKDVAAPVVWAAVLHHRHIPVE